MANQTSASGSINDVDNRSIKAPSICFVAHNAYGALVSLDNGHIGGIEVQQSMMAKWLAAQGYHVNMITWDEGQRDGEYVDGVRLYKMCGANDGLPGLRNIYPKWTSLVRGMKMANSDIYYYNCGDMELGQVVMWARSNGKKVMYTVANDSDCVRDLPLLRSFRDRVFYKYGLLRADSVVTQTNNQQRMLLESFGIQSTVIPMPCKGFPGGGERGPNPPDSRRPRVLWVGRFSWEKRLEWLLDCAGRLEGMIFDVVGTPNLNSSYTEELARRAGAIGNVILHGRVPHEEMERFYRQATVLCSTSRIEGFPNIYLEAWSVGLPIVSTFDPDGVISRHGLGAVVDSVDQLIDALRSVTSSPELWRKYSASAKEYYKNNHAVEASMSKFEAEFIKLAWML